jgi:benzylsuccinate CoA-transferase BbsF subunit
MEKQILAGVKVLDFGWALVGSLTGKYLGDFGAEVVRVESKNRYDLIRSHRIVNSPGAGTPDGNPTFTHLNTSKYGITINLKHPRVHEAIDPLIRWADVVNANFIPGTLEHLGLGYDYMNSINPQIIMAEGSVYGKKGPTIDMQGVDGNGGALSGYLDLTGWPDRDPNFPNAAYGDVVLPFFLVSAVVSALEAKRKTGRGMHIDAAMLDVNVQMITPALLDWQANKHIQTRSGNRIAYAAPHGVFPCLGDDRWCAIAVFSEQEWKDFCSVIGNPDWTCDAKFANLALRKANEDELEKLVSDWTSQHSAEEIMQSLQKNGVSAGVVQNARDVMDNDIHFQKRKMLKPIKHPVLGVFNHPDPPFKISHHRPHIRTSPCLGEHNEFVLTELAGLSDRKFIELFNAGVFE